MKGGSVNQKLLAVIRWVSCHRGHLTSKERQDLLHALWGNGSTTPVHKMSHLRKSRTAQTLPATRSAKIMFHALKVEPDALAEKLGKDAKALNEMSRVLTKNTEEAKKKLEA